LSKPKHRPVVRHALAYEGSKDLKDWRVFRRVSNGGYYELVKRGMAPVTMLCGKRRVVSAEADRAWVMMMERETSAIRVFA
jgi:hypothetical protein